MGKIQSVTETVRDRGVGTMLSAVSRLAWTSIERKLMGRRFQLRNIHDYKMYLDTDDLGLSRSLFLFATREVDHKVMLEQIIRPGMTIFDIGGNIGYYPLMELKLLKDTGKMVIVEPSPSNVELLRRNLELNNYGDVPLLQAAISDVAGDRTFFLSEQSNLGTFHPEGSAYDTLSGNTVEVEMLTVPQLAEQYGAPDLLRMDVEGHEVEVLNGMLDDVAAGKYAPTVIFETHLTRYGEDHDIGATLRRMFELGYRVPCLSSSSQRGTKVLKDLGYKPGQAIPTDGVERVLFYDIDNEHAIDIVARTGGARTVILAKD